ncbi:GRF-type domain-containing protein [Heracleum sosnowskyi]|uniref:GRF-type domain-containing protein n=1 Tax=Heracleum sosnowskyi TaxID=360622 RepID=A0AAD8HEK2_9APIA|nr:GRF-type domain-containing protein [Heracleum sosnowskyi]
MATSSARSSRGSSERFICDCGQRAKMYTSWSLKIPGRRFYTCPHSQDSRCDYFEWYDVEVEGRLGDVITHLNNRRIFLEEKIRLLEDTITMLKGRVATKKSKKKALQAKFAKFIKIFSFVIVILIAMLVMQSQKKKNGNDGWLSIM